MEKAAFEARARRLLGDQFGCLYTRPVEQIARITGLAPSTVTRYRKHFGGTVHLAAEPNKPNQDQHARVADRLGAQFSRLGVDSDADIARAVGLTGERIRQLRVEVGIPAPPVQPRSRLSRLVRAGRLPLTIEEVAKAAGISVTAARSGLKKLGVTPPLRGRARVMPAPESEMVIRPLLASYGNEEIAARTGYSPARVGQIRAVAFTPAPHHGGRGRRLTTPDELIERAACALGADIDRLHVGNINGLARKHGLSPATLFKWRDGLRACGYFRGGVG